MSRLEPQVLNARYLVESKLVALLHELFPDGNFEWEADKHSYILRVPRLLTPEEQERAK